MNRELHNKVLTGAWIAIAVTALILTVVYLGRLKKIYDALPDLPVSEAGVNAAPDGTNAPGSPIKTAGDSTTQNPEKGDSQGIGTTDISRDIAAESQEAGDASADTLSQTGDAEGRRADAQAADRAAADAAINEESGATGVNQERSGNPSDSIEVGEDGIIRGPDKLDPAKPIIAMSFDDGPSTHTLKILEALTKHNVKATFFMVGYNIDEYKDIVKKVYDAGCEIGNHTLAHDSLSEGSATAIKKGVFDNEDKLNAIVPVGEIIVRPPYGNYSTTTKELIDRPLVCWSVDSLDWKTRNADSVVAQIQQDAKDGYIILMHDIYDSTAEAAVRIIPWLLEQGYQITTVSQMYELRGEKMKPGHVYSYTYKAPGKL